MNKELNLIKWLSKNYTSKPIFIDQTKQIDIFWCKTSDLDEKYDSEFDHKIKWYNSEEILEIYNRK